MQEFEIYKIEIGGFKKVIWEREKRKELEREQIRAKEVIEAAKAVESKIVPVAERVEGGTTQLEKT